jgi:phosphatidylglycerophosphatase A
MRRSARGVAWWLASVGGLGRVPTAPGSAASAAAAVVWYAVQPPPDAQLAMCLGAAALGLWVSSRVAAHSSEKDPSEVVIDELAGQWLTLAGLPNTPAMIGAGFLIFRLLDITKPPPLRRLERLPGGLGIMCDDLAAGLIGRLVLGAILFIFL